MTQASGGRGAAYDARVETQDNAPPDDVVLRAQGLLEEADDFVGRMQRKYDKIKTQLDDAKQALADAKDQQKTAKAELAAARRGGDG